MIVNDRLVNLIKNTKGMSISEIDIGDGIPRHVISIEVQ